VWLILHVWIFACNERVSDLRETGWGGVEWIHLVQDRDGWQVLVNAVMNLRVLAPRSLLINAYQGQP
jgi:hypothetical protein